MTQANNVAIESSQINSSGVLTVPGGGTGLSTVGTSGYYLQSNGSTLQYSAVPATNPGGTAGMIQYNSGSAFAGSANLFWDNTNTSFGVGTNNPSAPGGNTNLLVQTSSTLSIIKSATSLSSAAATARFDFATGTANSYSIMGLHDNSGAPYWQLTSGSAVTANYYDGATHYFRSLSGTNYLTINSSGNLLLSGSITTDAQINFKNSGSSSDTYAKFPLSTQTMYLRPATAAQLEFWSDQGSVGTVLRMYNSGQVSMPAQPYFYANNGGGTWSGNYLATLTSALYNVGNNFNTSTATFTAPLAGVYLFSWTKYTASNNGAIQLMLNGGEVAYADQSNNNGTHLIVTVIMKMAANDTMRFYTSNTSFGASDGNDWCMGTKLS